MRWVSGLFCAFGLSVADAFLPAQPHITTHHVQHHASRRLAVVRAATGSGDKKTLERVLIRQGDESDLSKIRLVLASQLMNPLFLQAERFVCAEMDGRLIGFGQVRPLDGGGGSFEVASLFVDEAERGKGIGSAIVRRLLERHGTKGTLYLLTLSKTTPFWERFGFRLVGSDEDASLPALLRLERSAGTLVAGGLLGQTVVVMTKDE
mmetsp:Transcript_19836/g.48085  ORF Transcript_19836/g.48085 Transcript_19836/m.48085 type:complete len:207 (-) Transcript_19836:225-845(-)